MNKRTFNTLHLVQAAFLVAISIAMTRFLYFFIPVLGVQGIRISFGEIPLMIGGLLFGPIIGGISGLAADIIGVMINPQGVFHPGFTLSSMLWGIIPGILGIYFKNTGDKSNPFTVQRIVLTVSICMVVISLGLNTLWLSTLYGKGFMVLLPARIITVLISVPINSFIIKSLIKHLRRLVSI